MSTGLTLVDKIVNISRDVGHVAKTGKNQAQGFNFRGIDAVVNAIAPAMRTAGVIVTPTLLNYYYDQIAVGANKSLVGHVRLEVRYTFTDGKDTISAVVGGEAMDSGDKATAKAMSVAFRTALLQVFTLPTDESDPDEHIYQRSSQESKAPGTRPITARAAEDEEEPFPSTPSRPSGRATEKQKSYIKDLAIKRSYEMDADYLENMTYDEASELINLLKQIAIIK